MIIKSYFILAPDARISFEKGARVVDSEGSVIGRVIDVWVEDQDVGVTIDLDTIPQDMIARIRTPVEAARVAMTYSIGDDEGS